MKEITSSIEINAPAKRVWEILANLKSHADWNPFIRSANGEVKAGAKLDIFIQPVGGSGMRFKPTVLKAEAGRELRWIGRLIFPGLFDGEHSFVIEPLGENYVRLTQSEKFTGLLVRLFAKGLDGGTLQGFELMNRALKARAETGTEQA
jgi:hypothetical protein